MKKSINPQSLLVTTIGLAVLSTFSMLLGYGIMNINSQINNVYDQGDRYVSGLTSRYGIQGLQDLKTDRERLLYQTIVWMNNRCATMAKLAYMYGHWIRTFGIGLMLIAVFNGVAWWKWKKDLQNQQV